MSISNITHPNSYDLYCRDLAVSANTSLTSTLESSSSTTGALTVAGGLGVAKHMHVGANAKINKCEIWSPNVSSACFSHEDRTGSLEIAFASFSSGLTFVNGTAVYVQDDGVTHTTMRDTGIDVMSTTASTSTTTGALKVAGGAGVAGDIYTDNMRVKSTTDGTTYASTMALECDGGARIAGNLLLPCGSDICIGVGMADLSEHLKFRHDSNHAYCHYGTGNLNYLNNSAVQIATMTQSNVEVNATANSDSYSGSHAFKCSGSGKFEKSIFAQDGESIVVGQGVGQSDQRLRMHHAGDTNAYIDFGTGSLIIRETNWGSRCQITTNSVIATHSEQAVSTTTGALISSGGLAIAGDFYMGGSYAEKASGTAFANPSDESLKENITDPDVQKAVKRFRAIEFKEYNFNEAFCDFHKWNYENHKQNKHLSCIAQQVKEVYDVDNRPAVRKNGVRPSRKVYDSDGVTLLSDTPDPTSEKYTLDYGVIDSDMRLVVQKLCDRVDSISARVEALEAA